MKNGNLPYIIGLFSLSWMACGKAPPPINPYEQSQQIQQLFQTDDSLTLSPESFASIHYHMLKPTCANSGCHDGHFEPDFRTIESSYNTLVWQPIIKNSPDAVFSYRVVPGDIKSSILWIRLHEDLDGRSGIMPLVVGPESDWANKKSWHLSNLRTWIENGAPDIFGNVPQQDNLPPTVTGLFARVRNQSEILARKGDNGSFLVPLQSDRLSLFFRIEDDQLASHEIQSCKIRFSTALNGFTDSLSSEPVRMINPVSGIDFYGETQSFFHSYTFDLSEAVPGETWYFRVSVLDPVSHEITEIPSLQSASYTHEWFSFKLQD